MNKRLSHTQSMPDVPSTIFAESFQEVIDSFKQSLKIVAQGFKAEINQLKTELKEQKQELLEKIELIVICNKQSEETIHQFHQIITETTKKALKSIDELKVNQSSLSKELKNAKSKNYSDLPLKPNEKIDDSWVKKLNKDIERAEGNIQGLYEKIDYVNEEMRNPELLSFNGKVREMQKDLEKRLESIEVQQRLIEKDANILKRFEDIEDFISLQRRELFGSITVLEQKIQKSEQMLRNAVNSIASHFSLSQLII